MVVWMVEKWDYYVVEGKVEWMVNKWDEKSAVEMAV
jgi:hypothetical protein